MRSRQEALRGCDAVNNNLTIIKMSDHHPIMRMQLIDEFIRGERYPNCTIMARKCNVTRRCIMRDIDFMRDRLEAPIGYNAKQRGYYYTKPDWSMLMSNILTVREIDALIMARQLLLDYEGSPFFEEVQQALSNVRQGRPGTWAKRVLPEIYSFGDAPERNFDPRLFALLDDAVRNGLKVRICYVASYEEGVSERLFDPYLFHYSHQKRSWYVVGFCNLRQAIRIIGLHMVREVRLTDEHFTVMEGFDAKMHLERTFGTPEERKCHNVTLHFSSARTNLYGTILHPTQYSDLCSDGSFFLSCQVEDLEPIAKFLAREKRGVKIHSAPLELKSMVKKLRGLPGPVEDRKTVSKQTGDA